MAITGLSATDLRHALTRRQVSARELTESCLRRIDRHDGAIGAFLQVDAEEALRQADAADRRRAAGESLSPLDGIPVAVKDVLCTRGGRTTCSSRMLAQFVSPYEATVVSRLRRAGLVLLGKTNLDEFAMGGSTENAALGTTCNPWDRDRVPGGSSGGSAAAVAARMVPLAIGTDTGGSIRQPSAYCGTVGLTPTYGRVSRYGLVAFASSLDQVGPMARTAADTASLLAVIAGGDPRDSTCADVAVPGYVDALREPIAGLKFGIVRDHLGEGLDPQVRAAVEEAVDVFRSLGAPVRDVALPHSKYGIATYYLIASCEASSNLARYDGVRFGLRVPGNSLDEMYELTRAAGFGKEVKRRILIGTYVLSAGYYDAYYLQAQRVRALILRDFTEAFKEVDVILTPSTPSAAFGFNENEDDPVQMYLNDVFTVTVNLAGLPGISVPAGLDAKGLPLGLQLIGRAFDEETLLRTAGVLERCADFTALPAGV